MSNAKSHPDTKGGDIKDKAAVPADKPLPDATGLNEDKGTSEPKDHVKDLPARPAAGQEAVQSSGVPHDDARRAAESLQGAKNASDTVHTPQAGGGHQAPRRFGPGFEENDPQGQGRTGSRSVDPSSDMPDGQALGRLLSQLQSDVQLLIQGDNSRIEATIDHVQSLCGYLAEAVRGYILGGSFSIAALHRPHDLVRAQATATLQMVRDAQPMFSAAGEGSLGGRVDKLFKLIQTLLPLIIGIWG